MSWGVDSGLESEPNCDFSTERVRRRHVNQRRSERRGQNILNPTVTKPNVHVSVGYPTVTLRYVEVELDAGWRLVVVGGGCGSHK